MSYKRIVLAVPHAVRTLYCFVRQLQLLAFEVWVVFFFMHVLKKKRMPEDHSWKTGTVAGDPEGSDIWPRNIVYRSPSRFAETTESSDARIVSSVGRFLAAMVRRSCVEPELPQGPKRRMPHAVNFLHGAIHYNGAFVVLDDFRDLVSHLTDRRFRRDLLSFGRDQKREVTIVLRQRKYDPLDFAYAIGAVRAHLPWFSNGNGPTKRPVLWGNMSPHPAVATINGAWMADLWKMYRGDFDGMIRPPIDSREHFAQSYFGRRNHYGWGDRFLAWFQYQDVRSRGFRGQIFFSNRSQIEPHRVGEYREAGGYLRWTACHAVPAPAFRSPRRPAPVAVSKTDIVHAEGVCDAVTVGVSKTGTVRVSVVIPTLDEEEEIVGCIDAAKHFLRADEVIVADGGSRDDTVRLARERGARVIRADGGRGGQCRAGAAVSSGEVIVFVHADARVTAGAREALEETMLARGRAVSMFRQRSTIAGKRYRFLDFLSRFDTIFTRFGDQGIIVRADFYRELGGMPRMRLFEDVVFLRRARRRGVIHRIPSELRVSPRRYRHGVLQYLFNCAKLFALYFIGTDPAELHARYYGEGRR